MTHQSVGTHPSLVPGRSDTREGSLSKDTGSFVDDDSTFEERFDPRLLGFAQLVLADADGWPQPIRFDCPSNPSLEPGS